MSRLQVYWPAGHDDPDSVGESTVDALTTPFVYAEPASSHPKEHDDHDGGQPQILKFEVHARRIRSTPQYDVAQRARKLHRNNICPHCHSIRIIPLHFNDGRHDQAGAVIPMTASLVAFHCERCQAEWPA